jgi:hypothetical protein
LIVRRVHPHYLRQAIAAKAYGGPCGLIVYLNINEFGIRQAETEHTIEAATGCTRELSCSLALFLKPLSIVGASCGGRGIERSEIRMRLSTRSSPRQASTELASVARTRDPNSARLTKP